MKMNTELATMTAERLRALLSEWRPAQIAKRLGAAEKDILGLMRHFKLKQPVWRKIDEMDRININALRKAGRSVEQISMALNIPCGLIQPLFGASGRFNMKPDPAFVSSWPDYSGENLKIRASSLGRAIRNGRVAYQGSLTGNSGGMCVDGIGALPAVGRR